MLVVSDRSKIVNNESLGRAIQQQAPQQPQTQENEDDDSSAIVGFSIDDVRHHTRTRTDRKTQAFRQVAKRCYGHIRRRISIRHRICYFKVPEFVFGAPLYRLDECVDYIRQHLLMNGFNVVYMFPDILAIRWSTPEEDAAEANRMRYYALPAPPPPPSLLPPRPSPTTPVAHLPPPTLPQTHDTQQAQHRPQLSAWERDVAQQLERMNPPRRVPSPLDHYSASTTEQILLPLATTTTNPDVSIRRKANGRVILRL